jgi:AcrR family transcriptional regulator
MQADPITSATRPRRGGRPAAKDAGDVDRRILDAAASLFRRLGFDATSCDQVVAQAGAGKASLYARYANKEALFTAVVHDHVEHSLAPAGDISLDLPLAARLQAVGHSLATHSLQPDVVALMRVVLATANRLPDLARLADQIGRDRAVERVAATIVGTTTGADTLDRARRVADTFIDLVYVPMQMRALLGDDLAILAEGADKRIGEAVLLLKKSGLLDDWA